MTRRRGLAWRAVIAAAALATATRATAGLGEVADSVAVDREALAAEPRGTIVNEGFTVERMQSSANEVREFVSPSGVVFGVAWDGISHPDLARLLGSYAPEYGKAAAKASATPRRRRSVRTVRLVLETWGHMRSLHGRAYVPGLVPEGVSVDAIR